MLSNPVSQVPVVWFFMIVVAILLTIETWQHGIRKLTKEEVSKDGSSQ